ncbi:hypothetical protein SCHPADRAFT_908432 [Schizopora paradoxa]|uniref:Smr domain-containing protein n=1 Tax=Schizopora paradoxa TaxID=27342 RepID=A0A0H2RBA7_9AGAM|nr:hypothetical protein SCHPADRAFT_908432 [Schizopora paradoxa]
MPLDSHTDKEEDVSTFGARFDAPVRDNFNNKTRRDDASDNDDELALCRIPLDSRARPASAPCSLFSALHSTLYNEAEKQTVFKTVTTAGKGAVVHDEDSDELSVPSEYNSRGTKESTDELEALRSENAALKSEIEELKSQLAQRDAIGNAVGQLAFSPPPLFPPGLPIPPFAHLPPPSDSPNTSAWSSPSFNTDSELFDEESYAESDSTESFDDDSYDEEVVRVSALDLAPSLTRIPDSNVGPRSGKDGDYRAAVVGPRITPSNRGGARTILPPKEKPSLTQAPDPPKSRVMLNTDLKKMPYAELRALASDEGKRRLVFMEKLESTKSISERNRLTFEAKLCGTMRSYYNGQAAANAFDEHNDKHDLCLAGAAREIDLHGLYRQEVSGYLADHVRKCMEHNLLKTIVIHGKGIHSEPGTFSLKDEMDIFLEINDFLGREDVPGNDGRTLIKWDKGVSADSVKYTPRCSSR